MELKHVRLLNLALTAIGVTVFVALLAYVTLAPKDFDHRTRDFAVAKIEAKFDEELGSLAQSDSADKVSAFAGRFSERLQGQIDDLRGSLDAGIDQFIADILASACKLDCERREEARLAVRGAYEATIARYGVALDRVEAMVTGEYDEVMGELRGDLTIFSGSNAALLGFAFLLAIFRGNAARHLVPISFALTGLTALMIYWYIFGQDWVMAIIFSNYWGWTYAIVLGVLSVLLIDIAANKARITSAVLNGLGGVFNSGVSFAPC